jgi:hypothetical protein
MALYDFYHHHHVLLGWADVVAWAKQDMNVVAGLVLMHQAVRMWVYSSGPKQGPVTGF